MTKKIISVITMLVILSMSVITFAATASELTEKKNELQDQIDENEEKINSIDNEVDSVLTEIEQLDSEIMANEEEIETLNAELTSLNNEIDTLETKIEEEQAKYDEQYDTLCKRLVAQYKMGNTSYLDVLLNSKSLSDFISKYYIIGKIADYDTKLLEQIDEQKTAIENSKSELETKQSELSEKQAQLKTEELRLSNAKANKNKYVSQLTDEQKALQEQIDKYNEEMQAVEKEFQELARQAASSSSSSGGGYVYTGGELQWPCPNYSRISSYFGGRSSPGGGVGSRNHKGIDLAASHGTAIIAAEGGTVIKVSNTCSHDYGKTPSTRCGCGGGYGNYLMISHGNGLVTLYAHCASISVSVGQTVSRGQQIATVGSTGYSTGNHLHFGVLLNGTYVNPMSYLGN